VTTFGRDTRRALLATLLAVHDPTVTVTETEGSSELHAGPRLLMVVTQQDARSLGVSRAAIAQQYARELEAAIRSERLRHAPATLIRSGIYGLLATLALGAVLWLIQRLSREIRGRLGGWLARRRGALRVQHAEIVSADRLGRAAEQTILAIRFVLFLLAFDLYLTYVLGLFPWTRAVSSMLLGYLLTPIRAAASAFVGYLPKLLFVIVIAGVTIGYDAPWRKVHDLLVEAALATPGVLERPRPFVWQTALNDFYVTYEINAYTDTPREMIDIYAALHARIQDAFYAAGVEIMSPHYTSLRDGNTVAIPEACRAPEYRAPAFRVEATAVGREPAADSAGVARPA
jgi:Mechanosensitive ion channel